MQLPNFKYSPNAYHIDVFEQEEGICSVCAEKRYLKYTGSFYAEDEPEYICPWCIHDGSAAEEYDGNFNNTHELDKDKTLPPNLIEEISQRTPSYISWQQEVWLSHCNQPCAFIGYADSKRIQPILEELQEDIALSGFPAEEIENNLTNNGHLGGYLFQCLVCEKHRLHVDCN